MKIWKKAALGLFAAAACMALLAGCWTPWGEISDNVDNSKQLRVGMTKEQVLQVMGEPLTDESYCQPDVWFYYWNTIWHDGLVTEDECIPLVFKDGKLAGWGNPFYTRFRIERRTTTKSIDDR